MPALIGAPRAIGEPDGRHHE